MQGSPATQKQIDYILSLCKASYLSQARQRLGLSSSKCNRGLTKSEASEIIEDLKAGKL